MKMTAKELLLHQTRLAFCEDGEMSIKASLHGVTEEIANWKSPDGLPTTIADIVWHVAWAKLWYLQQAFGLEANLDKPATYAAKVARLDEAYLHLMQCLAGCSEEQLTEPAKTRFHSESVAHLFSILIIHDISHGASIRARKRLFQQMKA
jgi:hypothetical protein